MDNKSRATLADVAAAAGVSKMTASRALRGARDVSKNNFEKVQKAAREIGYVGNHLASALSGKRSDLIGVVIPSIANIVFAEVLAGIAEAIEGTGLQTVFGVTDYDLNTENDVIRNMLSWNPAGLIVTGLDQSNDAKRLLENTDIPVVQIMDLDGDPIDTCVGFSHRAAGAEMAASLLEMGRKRIGYIGRGVDVDVRAKKRLNGFREHLSHANIDLMATKIGAGPSGTNIGREMTSELLSQHPDLDCIYYSNDDLAAGGALHCIASGIAVPDTLTLAGFNGLEIITSLPVSVLTSRTPRRDVGRTAAQLIVDVQKGSNNWKKQTLEFPPVIAFGT
ncbi:LacI family DNA-binding transcriptional regulator [Planktotalea sp.]|uniref:LacI family DNA-binding transcriptional regulator n=1 Tax=Planktotalea sp. TaxID=2029877 RepID=UPI003D6BD892